MAKSKPPKPINLTQRTVAGEKLHMNGVVGHVMAHELYRVAKGAHKAGLTKGEQAYLAQIHDDLTDVLRRQTLMRVRLLKPQ